MIESMANAATANMTLNHHMNSSYISNINSKNINNINHSNHRVGLSPIGQQDVPVKGTGPPQRCESAEVHIASVR